MAPGLPGVARLIDGTGNCSAEMVSWLPRIVPGEKIIAFNIALRPRDWSPS